MHSRHWALVCDTFKYLYRGHVQVGGRRGTASAVR